MRNCYFIALCFIFLIPNSWAQSSDIKNRITSLLPKEILELTSKHDRIGLEKKFKDKIYDREDQNHLYLQYFDKKNDLTFEFKNGKLYSILILLPPPVARKDDSLFADTLKAVRNKSRSKPSDESGRFIEFHLDDVGMYLKFRDNEKKDLYSVTLYPKSKK